MSHRSTEAERESEGRTVTPSLHSLSWTDLQSETWQSVNWLSRITRQ